MTIQLIRLLASIIAGGIVMIIHEFPKALIYNLMNPNQEKNRKRNIYKLHHYIDPIGMILCATNQAGFSKPYMYRIKDKKTNLILGITGFISLLITFAISISVLKFGIGMGSNFAYSESISMVQLILQCILVYIALISLSMTIVNLFPISTFDIGLILAGTNPKQFYNIIRYDYFVKMILLLVVLFQLLTSLSTFIMSALL
ncbi:MAG: hypothetical protein K0S41_1044 [Anaerocolumna sp.]|nr:hypothetical protein [Anaerocolumna sp.]